MIKTILTILWLSLGATALAENVVIKFIVDTRGAFHPKRTLGIVDAENRNNPFIRNFMDDPLQMKTTRTDQFKDSTTEIFTITYAVTKEKCYFFTDGFGQEILLSPGSGDTITVHLSRPRVVNNSAMLNDSIVSPWFSLYEFDRRHAYVHFFDSLARLHGDINVRLTYSYKLSKNRLPEYLSLVKKVYRDRLDFFRQFCNRNYFPEKLKYYALKEIQYAFYDDLLDPILYYNNVNDYPSDLVDSLNHIGDDLNDTDLFHNTSLYRKIFSNYIFCVKIQRSKEYRDSTHLADAYSFCESHLKEQIRDYLEAVLLNEYIKYDPHQWVRTLYPAYLTSAATSFWKKDIDSLYNLYINLSPPTREEILSLALDSGQDGKVTLRDIAVKHLILVDCWATWCLPCKAEQPFLDTITQDFSEKVQFIALSADVNIAKWLNYHRHAGSGQKNIADYHAPGAFENLFFKKLHISAIPRYVLLSDKGEVIDQSMPRPSDMVAFRNKLRSYLKLIPSSL